MADDSLGLPPGFRLQELEIESVLASTDSGVKYICMDHQLERRVAVEEFMPGLLAVHDGSNAVVPASASAAQTFEEMLGQFLAEAAALAEWRHPNIVEVHRTLRANGTAYVVMDYVEGQTLSGILDKVGTVPDDPLQQMLHPLLDCLEAMHRADLQHQRIQPGNIVLGGDGAPVLLARGLVGRRFSAARQAFGDRARSRRPPSSNSDYDPLEMYSGSAGTGPWTDMYALAATLHHCVTGAPPPAALDRIIEDTITPAAEAARGEYRQDFLAGIDAALATHPTQRPRNVAAWRDLLWPDKAPPHRRPMPELGRTAARGPRLPAAGRPAPANDRRRPWMVPALTLTAVTAVIAWLDTGLLRSAMDDPLPGATEVAVEETQAIEDLAAATPAAPEGGTEGAAIADPGAEPAAPEPEDAGADAGATVPEADVAAVEPAESTVAEAPGSASGDAPEPAESTVAGAPGIPSGDAPEPAESPIAEAPESGAEVAAVADPGADPASPQPEDAGATVPEPDIAAVEPAGLAVVPVEETPEIAPGDAPEPEMPAPPLGPERGTLIVETEPPGVDVLVDGQIAGVTPIEIGDMASGSYDVVLQHPFYESMQLAGQAVGAGEEVRIEKTLHRAIGDLLVTVDPDEAWVEWNGQRSAGPAPIALRDLPAGPVELTLGAPGYRTALAQAEVPKGSTGSLDYVLEVAYGTLTLELEPDDAHATIATAAGERHPYLPGMQLAEGEHRLEVARDGYLAVERTAQIAGDTLLRIALVSEPPPPPPPDGVPADEQQAIAAVDPRPHCRLRPGRARLVARYPSSRGGGAQLIKDTLGSRNLGDASIRVTFSVDDDGRVLDETVAVDAEQSTATRARYFDHFSRAAIEAIGGYRFRFADARRTDCVKRQPGAIVFRFAYE